MNKHTAKMAVAAVVCCFVCSSFYFILTLFSRFFYTQKRSFCLPLGSENRFGVCVCIRFYIYFFCCLTVFVVYCVPLFSVQSHVQSIYIFFSVLTRCRAIRSLKFKIPFLPHIYVCNCQFQDLSVIHSNICHVDVFLLLSLSLFPGLHSSVFCEFPQIAIFISL